MAVTRAARQTNAAGGTPPTATPTARLALASSPCSPQSCAVTVPSPYCAWQSCVRARRAYRRSHRRVWNHQRVALCRSLFGADRLCEPMGRAGNPRGFWFCQKPYHMVDAPNRPTTFRCRPPRRRRRRRRRSGIRSENGGHRMADITAPRVPGGRRKWCWRTSRDDADPQVDEQQRVGASGLICSSRWQMHLVRD